VAEVGDILAGWVLVERLGRGSMGTVYRAHRVADASELGALKTLVEEDDVPDAARRFAREGQLLASLDHPGITRFIEAHDDPPVLVMEFVVGQSLDLRLQAGPLPVEQAIHLVRQMCDALVYLHARQIWHRDIKPGNIIIEPAGWTRLVDFGIAVAKDSTRYTQTGTLMGSLAYVPPEAIEGEPDPTAWDIYSLGVVFCEALSGQAPFGVNMAIGPLIAAKQTRRFLDPGPGFSDEVRALVRHMTAADPRDRLPNAAAVARRARALVGGQGPLIDAGIRPVALEGPPRPGPRPVATEGFDEVPLGHTSIDRSTLTDARLSTATAPDGDAATARIPARSEPAPPPPPPAPAAQGFGFGALAAVATLSVLLTLFVVGLPTAGWLAMGTLANPEAPVEIVVSDLEPNTPAAVWISGARAPATGAHHFRSAPLAPGAYEALVIAGEGCDVDCVPGKCGPCCAMTRHDRVAGTEPVWVLRGPALPTAACAPKRPASPAEPPALADEPPPASVEAP
jgi:serine/threonine-protein kinase